ncbi:MAG: ketoacyl-ACP synthase III [Desulfovibrio sp.]|nr:ketoacyl-ACP synthase III [Desulfovibrio sp.]
MFYDLHHVSIAAVRAAVPENEVRLEDEAEFYGGSLKKIARLRATLGMDRRRICPPDVTASDLCAAAARRLLADYPEYRQKVDALIFLSQSPDWVQPATACELQDRLGLPRSCAAFDVNQGCAGYIYGLWLAGTIINAGARAVLLLVGDAPRIDVRNRVIASVFGDGGSATLLLRKPDAPVMQLGFGTDGSAFETIIVPAGQARIPYSCRPEENADLVTDTWDTSGNPWQMVNTFMDGGAVFNFTMDVVPGHLKEALNHARLTPEDINWLILHQANKHIVDTLAERVGIPLEKTPDGTFGKYGNLASASIPAALCDTFSAVRDPGMTLMCGYGIGLAWGSCLCRLENLDCAPVMDFVPDPHRPTRQQRIERWKKIFSGEIARHDKE